MNKSKLLLYLCFGIVGVGLFQGCKDKKKIVDSRIESVSNKEKFEFLVDSLNAHLSLPNNISIKSKVHFETPKLSDSFKMHIRMKRDSIIWISATYYKVEVARIILLPDSVKMIDRKNGKYFLGDYSYIQNRFKIPIDFYLFQAIILGNPFSIDSAVKVRAYTSRGNIILASLYNTWYDNGSGEKHLKQQTTQMWINPKTFRVRKNKIAEYKTKKHFTTTYSDTAMIEGFGIPNGAVYLLRDQEEMKFTSHYLKLESKPNMSFPFNIPSKYERIL